MLTFQTGNLKAAAAKSNIFKTNNISSDNKNSIWKIRFFSKASSTIQVVTTNRSPTNIFLFYNRKMDQPSNQPPTSQPPTSQPLTSEPLASHVLWSQFTEEQLNRYEMFRRSTFPKASIKRFMQSLSGSSVSQNVVIAMSGIAKVFVGELVEEAIKIQKRYGETGPIEPKHIREAHRVIKNRSDRTLKLA